MDLRQCVQTQTTETTRILTPGLSGFASVLAKMSLLTLKEAMLLKGCITDA